MAKRYTADHPAMIVLVDDHDIVRRGLTMLIDAEENLKVCAGFSTAHEALKYIDKSPPDLAIIDITLQDRSGLELVKDLKVRDPELPILMLSMHDEGLYAERALRAGARGYLMKEEPGPKVIEGIRAVLAGRIFVSEAMASKMLNVIVGGKPDADASPLSRLTDRELEVYDLIGHGVTTREVADRLSLSIKTIESYRANIKDKLGLKNAVELVQHAIQWVQSGEGRE